MANIINKGIKYTITARGNLIEGKEYTCTLYYNVKQKDYRASSTTIAQQLDNDVVCVFVFTKEMTASLKAGNVHLEIFDEDATFMSYTDNFAVVRANSLSE